MAQINQDQACGMTVFVAVMHGNKVEHHLVPLNPKQATKVFNFIKHQCHGGTLTLTAKTFPLERLLEEEKSLIVSP